ncbi:MAG: hypothetical protein NTU97_01820 [Candidatus Magasanikbacteria bacterium]|nr:hypothetical protein [Candidatus Magasanikbacteria bacterium]
MLKKISGIFLSLSFLLILTPQLVSSQGLGSFANAISGANEAAELSGVKEKGKEKAIEEYIQSIVSVALSLIGLIFFILMIYGGFIWMKARGEAKEAERAKEIITMSVIGLVVIILAYAISSFVITRIVAIGQTTK